MERKGVCRLVSTIALVVVAAELAAGPALGYILPAEAIMAGVARRRSDIGFSSIVLEGKHKRAEGTEEKVWEAIRVGKGHRVERKDAGGGTSVTLTLGQKRWTFKLGERPPAPERVNTDVLLGLVANTEKDPSGQRGLTLLKALGIDDTVVTMARLDKRIAYVIGAKPWELNKPQMWIDKELYVPVRVIQVDKKSGAVTDTRFLGIGSAVTGEWYPERIELWREGKLVESTTYSSVRLNEDVSEDLFRPPT